MEKQNLKKNEKNSLFDLVGLLSDNEAEELKENIKQLRIRMRKELDKTTKEIRTILEKN